MLAIYLFVWGLVTGTGFVALQVDEGFGLQKFKIKRLIQCTVSAIGYGFLWPIVIISILVEFVNTEQLLE